MRILGTVIGDDRVDAKFARIAAKSMPILVNRIGRVVYKLEGRVKTRKLSGQVLKVRSGTLRRDIHSEVTTESNKVTGKTGTNMEYAGVHEYGFHDTVEVREHLRRTKAEAKLFIRGNKKGQVNLAATKKAQREKQATVRVRAHTRKANFPEWSFLRSALADMRAEILTEVYGGVKEMVNS